MMMLFEEDAAGMAIPDGFCIEEISSPITAHILDFYDGGLGNDLFAAATTTSGPFPATDDDVSSSATTTPPICSYSDDAPAAGATAYSPLPSFDTTLTALLEEEQHHGLDTELLPQIDGLSEVAYYPTATDEASIGQFNQMGLPETLAEQVPPMQMSSSASALMPLTSDYDECFTAALAGGFMGLDGAMYRQTGAILPGSSRTIRIGGLHIQGCPPVTNSAVLTHNKMQYACRKTLADSRPRVRGRFAKNDELCEAAQSGSQSHEHYEQTDHMKEEEMLDTSEILAQLSGFNFYNYKYKCTIESWI